MSSSSDSNSDSDSISGSEYDNSSGSSSSDDERERHINKMIPRLKKFFAGVAELPKVGQTKKYPMSTTVSLIGTNAELNNREYEISADHENGLYYKVKETNGKKVIGVVLTNFSITSYKSNLPFKVFLHCNIEKLNTVYHNGKFFVAELDPTNGKLKLLEKSLIKDANEDYTKAMRYSGVTPDTIKNSLKFSDAKKHEEHYMIGQSAKISEILKKNKDASTKLKTELLLNSKFVSTSTELLVSKEYIDDIISKYRNEHNEWMEMDAMVKEKLVFTIERERNLDFTEMDELTAQNLSRCYKNTKPDKMVLILNKRIFSVEIKFNIEFKKFYIE